LNPAKALFLFTATFSLVACSTPVPTDKQTLPPTPSATQEPSASPAPSDTATPSETVIYDFMVHACEAVWTNNAQTLVCPSQSYGNIGSGYVEVRENTNIEGATELRGTALLTHPSANGTFLGIFGAFPPIIIESGDQFRATLSCVDQVEAVFCDVEFALEYYTENGAYIDSQQTGWYWNQTQDEATTDIAVDLSILAGQTVRLVLVVRDNGDPEGDYALWVEPQLWRTR